MPLFDSVETVSTPNESHTVLTPRQRFLRERQQRQNTTFAIVGVSLITVVVLAVLVFTGIVPVPFGNDFSVKIEYAETGDIPCPTANSKPVAPSTVSVTVVNTTLSSSRRNAARCRVPDSTGHYREKAAPRGGLPEVKGQSVLVVW